MVVSIRSLASVVGEPHARQDMCGLGWPGNKMSDAVLTKILQTQSEKDESEDNGQMNRLMGRR